MVQRHIDHAYRRPRLPRQDIRQTIAHLQGLRTLHRKLKWQGGNTQLGDAVIPREHHHPAPLQRRGWHLPLAGRQPRGHLRQAAHSRRWLQIPERLNNSLPGLLVGGAD
ncbi:hypothetical protein GCM10027031_10320 [Corynebacterium atrinae]